MEENQIVKENEAYKAARVINLIVDFICSFVFILITLLILAILLAIFQINPDILTKSESFFNVLAVFLYVIYSFLIEYITKGRSIGKYITGTKVVMLNGSKPTTGVLFRRNLYRLIPLDVFSFLFGKGFHDTISKTRVVMKKDFENEINKRLSL